MFAVIVLPVFMALAAGGVPASAETLTFDDAATLDEIMARHPGWSYHQEAGGEASLDTGVSGKCFAANSTGGYGPVYLRRTFSSGQQTLYIGFSLKLSAIRRISPHSQWELVRLMSGKQIDMKVHLTDTRHIVFTTDVGGAPIAHHPGAYWWPEKWTRVVIGLKKGSQGYLKVWADGTCIYANDFDTGGNLVDELQIGVPYGWDGARYAGKTLLDDVAVGTAFSQVDKEPARIVTVKPNIQRIVNPDCFGIHLGWYGWGWDKDYPKVIEVAKQLGATSGRAHLQTYRDWDYHWPYFTYKPSATDPPGATIAEHLFAMSSDPDPLMVCVLNMFGEKGADWRPEKAAELIDFNRKLPRPDGRTGLRGLYELADEPSLHTPITEGWYYRKGKYIQIGNGKTTYSHTFNPADPEYLSNTDPVYNYRLEFAEGDYLYIGHRWRFDTLAYVLDNRSKVSGNKDLRWEYWNGAEWVRFGDVPHCPFTLEYPTRAHDLTGSGGWNFSAWNDTAMVEWTRTSMAEISGDEGLSGEALYYIRLAHNAGGYAGETPVESHMSVIVSPTGYLEAMRIFFPVIADTGEEFYVAPGDDGFSREYLDMLEQNPSLFDGISWHSYPSLKVSTSMIPGQTYVPPTSMLWNVDRIAERAAELRRRFPDKKLALTEWNVTGTPTDPIRTLAGGLRTAIGLCQIAASGWEVGIYHCLYTPSFYDAFNLLAGPPDAPRLRPSGWAFKAVKEHGKRYVLETTSTYRGIYACGFAGSDSSDGSLVIVNRTENYETVTMSLPGSWKKLTVYEMTASSLNADNETANNVTLKYKATLDGSAEMTYKFPPYSLTIFDTGPR